MWKSLLLKHVQRCRLIQVRQQMEEQVAQKCSELEQYLQRVRELEDMYRWLEEALEDERRAKHDEEAMRKLQARSQKLTRALILDSRWTDTGKKHGHIKASDM